MAAISLKAGATVAPVNEFQPVLRTYVAAAALSSGAIVRLAASGRVELAANTGARIGVVIGGAVGAGYPVTVLQLGTVDGYDVSALAYGASVYAGANGVADTAGTVTIGTVVPMPESPAVKVVQINCL